MSFLIVGLGNPGEEYEGSRHNVGRIVLEAFRKKFDFPEWKLKGNTNALVSSGKIKKNEVQIIMPETFMNKSGLSVSKFVKSIKAARNLIVVYDDLDLPLGKIKISFNRSSGGHRGLLSIERNLKTREFIRLRVGITPSTKSGKLRKPQSEKDTIDFILGKFKKPELEEFKKISKQAVLALESIVSNGLQKAMGEYN